MDVSGNISFNAKSMSLWNWTFVYKKTYLTHNRVHILLSIYCVQMVDVIFTDKKTFITVDTQEAVDKLSRQERWIVSDLRDFRVWMNEDQFLF